ncbi:glycyl-radical enzyme activating protein [Alkalibacter mobilis]|uniref:glycyl-radical enzyme activating protein n=1 Tax=Alkalibacter mobilis TaxID=2787712 RepID=UPI0018A0C866|nr:glycyl-radical enzyme activating protein [Alkalibacter mobilis]MBF7095615.1 glycyl-radical enzyme activating protein [Alkalibacter mobilis]
MNLEITGRIYDIQGFSVHDGPGIRTSVFLSGCPLSCLWCHNPEAIPFQYVLSYTSIKCIGIEKCGSCMSVCNFGAIKKSKLSNSQLLEDKITHVEIDRTKCTNCLKCTTVCKAKALIPSGQDMKLGEIMNKLMKDKAYFNGSGGGLTVSGGEALSQIEFTVELLKAAKSENIHTCLDTTGFASWEDLKKTLPYVDLYLYDLKHMDSNKHKEFTGVPNEKILSNATKLAKEGAKIQFRFPIIPGINDSVDNLRMTGEFIKEIEYAVELLQILPYHRLGLPKYDRLGKINILKDLDSPSDADMEKHKNFLEAYFPNIQIH